MSDFDKKLEEDFQKALAAAMSPKKSAARRAYLTARRKEMGASRKHWQHINQENYDDSIPAKADLSEKLTQKYFDAVKHRQKRQGELGLLSIDTLSHLEKRRKNSR